MEQISKMCIWCVLSTWFRSIVVVGDAGIRWTRAEVLDDDKRGDNQHQEYDNCGETDEERFELATLPLPQLQNERLKLLVFVNQICQIVAIYFVSHLHINHIVAYICWWIRYTGWWNHKSYIYIYIYIYIFICFSFSFSSGLRFGYRFVYLGCL